MSQHWNRWIGALILVVIAVPAFAQTLDLGTVTVSLGMAKQQALGLFSEAGYKADYKVTELATTTSVLVVNNTVKQVCTVQLTGGRLTYASRSWTTEKGDGLDAAIKALSALAKRGAASCSVANEPISEPDTTAHRVFVKCGQRGVLMVSGKIGAMSDTYDVSEFIGAWHSP